METKVNYAIVGLFVLALMATLVAGVLWFTSGKQYGKTYDLYLTYMTESVSGLSLNAPVKYRGVEVGLVRKISLDVTNPEQVRLDLAIERGTPIKTDVRAMLRLQGLTGIAYVELEGGSREAPMLTPIINGEPPVIQSGKSLLARLDTGVSTLLTNLNRTSENFNTLLDEKNQRMLRQTLTDLAALSHQIASQRETLNAMLTNAGRTIENSARASSELTGLIGRMGRSADAVEKMAVEVGRASVSTRQTAENMGSDMHRFTGEALPGLQTLLVDMQGLTTSARRVIDELERNPEMLVRGKELQPPGPGE
jgi:phospholipid/cholesterol/gamma-HCH transport system substrate-binding protein